MMDIWYRVSYPSDYRGAAFAWPWEHPGLSRLTFLGPARLGRLYRSLRNVHGVGGR